MNCQEISEHYILEHHSKSNDDDTELHSKSSVARRTNVTSIQTLGTGKVSFDHTGLVNVLTNVSVTKVFGFTTVTVPLIRTNSTEL